eukprot:scaffold781_cov394-Prasinococcus_capsulatus_cf.AAC.36
MTSEICSLSISAKQVAALSNAHTRPKRKSDKHGWPSTSCITRYAMTSPTFKVLAAFSVNGSTSRVLNMMLCPLTSIEAGGLGWGWVSSGSACACLGCCFSGPLLVEADISGLWMGDGCAMVA